MSYLEELEQDEELEWEHDELDEQLELDDDDGEEELEEDSEGNSWSRSVNYFTDLNNLMSCKVN